MDEKGSTGSGSKVYKLGSGSGLLALTINFVGKWMAVIRMAEIGSYLAAQDYDIVFLQVSFLFTFSLFSDN